MSKEFNLMCCAYSKKYDCKMRPMMSGIYHDNGYQVATDTHILCAMMKSYPDEYEGKTLSKYGNIVEGRFPNWKSIIPRDLDEAPEFEINFKKWDEIKKTCKQELKEGKILKGRATEAQVFVKVGEAVFKMGLFDKLVKFMQSVGTNKIAIRGQYAAYAGKDGNHGLLMPMMANFPKIPNENLDGFYLNRVFSLA